MGLPHEVLADAPGPGAATAPSTPQASPDGPAVPGEDARAPVRLALIAATTAKGLEYDRVVVVEPADMADAEPDERTGLRRLYVVLTRAVSGLSVVHHRALPAELADPVSNGCAGDGVVAAAARYRSAGPDGAGSSSAAGDPPRDDRRQQHGDQRRPVLARQHREDDGVQVQLGGGVRRGRPGQRRRPSRGRARRGGRGGGAREGGRPLGDVRLLGRRRRRRDGLPGRNRSPLSVRGRVRSCSRDDIHRSRRRVHRRRHISDRCGRSRRLAVARHLTGQRHRELIDDPAADVLHDPPTELRRPPGDLELSGDHHSRRLIPLRLEVGDAVAPAVPLPRLSLPCASITAR